MTETRCPRCDEWQQIPDGYVGKEVKCRFCGGAFNALSEEVLLRASSRKPTPLPRHNDTLWGVAALGLLAVIFVGGPIYLVSSCKSRMNERESKRISRELITREISLSDDVHGAWAYTQQFVEQRLKSPKSADFPSWSREFVTPLGNARYSVRAYVDAQNSFGANLRTHFVAIIEKREGGWRLENLTFDE